MVKATNRIAKETKAKSESDVVLETKGDEKGKGVRSLIGNLGCYC